MNNVRRAVLVLCLFVLLIVAVSRFVQRDDVTGNATGTAQSIPAKGLVELLPDTVDLFEPDRSIVSNWNFVFLQTISAERVSPPQAARILAVYHRILDDIVNNSAVPAITDTDNDTIVAAASARMLVLFFPKYRYFYDQQIENLDIEQEALKKITTYVISSVITRNQDGSREVATYEIIDQVGMWKATPPYYEVPLLPHWGSVDPFVVTKGDMEILAPPSLDSKAYAKEYNEVKKMGGVDSVLRSKDQDEIAKFWADGKGTYTPPGHWNYIAGEVLKVKGLSVSEQVRLYAVLNTALADAGIATWNQKFVHNLWRPIDAVHMADKDGNADTEPDTEWFNYIETPNFPEYPSGHSTFSAAAATVLTEYFGDDVEFVSHSLGLPGVERGFDSFWEAANEAGMSRIYGGIHFQSANREGLRLGEKVADRVIESYK